MKYYFLPVILLSVAITKFATDAGKNGPIPADFVVKSQRFGKDSFRKGHTGIGLKYIICTQGEFPSGSSPLKSPGPFVGEIRIFAAVQGGSTPNGWVPCEGQTISIAGNNMLFALIGVQYGGDGRTTFAVPDLRGAVPVGAGNGWNMGEKSN